MALAGVSQSTVPQRRTTRALSFACDTPCPSQSAPKPHPSLPTAVEAEGPTPVNVVLRLRPLSAAEKTSGTETAITRDINKDGVIHIRPTNLALHSAAIRRAGQATFKFSSVLDETTSQQHLFSSTTLPLVHRLFAGHSSVVLAYGQTGSGKTWTIQGNQKSLGMLPRALHHILTTISSANGADTTQLNTTTVSKQVRDVVGAVADTVTVEDYSSKQTADRLPSDDANITLDPGAEYDVSVSYLEVYNEQCYDLFELPPKRRKSDPALAAEDAIKAAFEAAIEASEPLALPVCPPPRPAKRKTLKLKQLRGGDIRAEGLREIPVSSLADARALLAFGQSNRSVAHTNGNERSSRSHAIFTISLTATTEQNDKRFVSCSKLSFLDLAGNERTSRTSSGKRLKEAGKINESLMTLGRCLKDLRHNQQVIKAGKPEKKRLVPFRQSRLTRLLQPSLESGAAVIIVTCSPSLGDADDTIHTLRRAAVAQEITLSSVRPAPALKEIAANAVFPAKRSRLPRSNTALQGRIGKENNVNSKKVMAVEMLARELAETNRRLKQERMEREEEVLARRRAEQDAEDAREEANQYRDLVEGLTDRIQGYETRIGKMDMEIRAQVMGETEKLIKEIEMNYEKELEALRADNRSIEGRCSRITQTARKKMAQRVAGRASMAVASITYDMFSENEEGESSADEEEEIEDEQTDREEDEEDDSDMQSTCEKGQLNFENIDEEELSESDECE